MKLYYHAWIAEDLNVREERLHSLNDIITLSDLIHILMQQSLEKRNVFSKLEKIYISYNNALVSKDDLLHIKVSDEDTVAFFPAISGG